MKLHASATALNQMATTDVDKLKLFTDIPGPKALPKLGNWWRYLLGNYFSIHSLGQF